MDTSSLASMRLFQLISPSLPTGAFTYSQGLEWAIECGWVVDKTTLYQWLDSLLYSAVAELEIPILKRLYQAVESDNHKNFHYWSSYILACRETKELRDEEMNRGRALVKLIQQLSIEPEQKYLDTMKNSQLAGFAYVAAEWQIPLDETVQGYVWSWLENMVIAAVKTIPLGQAAGQQVLAELCENSIGRVLADISRGDDELGGSCPAFAISSSLHETQYTRLFRS